MGHMSDEEAEDLGWSDRFAMEQEEKDRIASLVEEVERLREALRPFARIADMEKSAEDGASVMVNVSRCRDARDVLEKSNA